MAFSYEVIKQRLLEEQAELREQMARIDIASHDGIGVGNHMADDGTDAFEQAKGVAVQRKLRDTLDMVDRALAKFDDGTYGICENCGAPIDKARLKVLPYAPMCMECQARRERG